MSKTVKVINEADSDVSDLDQQQLGQAMVVDKWAPQLGYCEDPETPLTADTFPSKSGGKPAWLNPEHILDVDKARCGVCEQPLALLVQLYTPEDQPEEAFHRTVYVFCCKDGACLKADWKKCFKVYRSQLPRDNPYYPPTQDDESDNDDVAIDFTPKKFTPPPQCVICGLSAPKTCGRCHTPHYCSRQHQMVDWNMCRHKEFCNKDMSKDEMETVERLRRGRIFAEKEIVNEPEGLGQDGKEEEAQKAHAQEQQASESNALALRGDEAYENSKVDVDEAFLKFHIRIGLYPDQVIRYERVEYNMPDREPLWVQEGQKPSVIPDCERCGGPRTFEFQILSTLLNFLGISHIAVDSLDWGSLYIYTCKRNCPVGSDIFAEEYLWKQDFSADGMNLAGPRPDDDD
ncbi:hypothetical protein VTP01DRAFT_1123 [Rhizomucor pusillus]|uniref:uncharacterized protein n=1 Tax=Rhizomucor pusillus TaxID=4840 RepID=UPI00374468CE